MAQNRMTQQPSSTTSMVLPTPTFSAGYVGEHEI